MYGKYLKRSEDETGKCLKSGKDKNGKDFNQSFPELCRVKNPPIKHELRKYLNIQTLFGVAMARKLLKN